MSLPRVMTPGMVAELWHCSERHVRNLIATGDLPSFRLGGKLLRIRGEGYGRLGIGRKFVAAHRIAYELVNGAIPDGLHIRHKCHNRLCCNPRHLTVGTPKQNARDSIEAGRFTRGTVNGNSKLDEQAVVYIRQNPDKMKGRELAAKFAISPATVSGIRNGRVWRHV